MKLFIKLLLFLTVLGFVAPFIIKDEFGRPLLNLRALQANQGEFKQSLLQTKAWFNTLLKKMRSAETQSTQTQQQAQENASLTYVYKWRDEQGLWQFSDQSPVNTQAKIITFNPEENILPSKSLASSHAKESPSNTLVPAETITQADTSVIPGLPTLEQAKKVFDDAKKVQGLSDKHARELERY